MTFDLPTVRYAEPRYETQEKPGTPIRTTENRVGQFITVMLTRYQILQPHGCLSEAYA